MPEDNGKKKRIGDFKNIKEIADVNKLQEIIKENQRYLDQTIKEKSTIEAENLNLKNEIKQIKNKVGEFHREKSLIEEKYRKINDLDKRIIKEKDLEIMNLRKELEDRSFSENLDEKVVKDLTKTELKLEEMKLYNTINMQELVETKSMLEIKENKLERMTHEVENLNKIIADHQFEKVETKNELQRIKSKLKSSFTAEDMSGYLNTTIESFNNQVNTVDSSVNYVINEMDVDLKAQVFKDEQNGMMFSSADLASKSEDTLSTIKFSIRAIPKL